MRREQTPSRKTPQETPRESYEDFRAKQKAKEKADLEKAAAADQQTRALPFCSLLHTRRLSCTDACPRCVLSRG